MPDRIRSDGVYTSVARTDMNQSSMRQLLKGLGPVMYAVQIGEFIKIGHTIDLSNRMYQYGPAATLLAWATGKTRADELAVHRSLVAHVAQGREWYAPAPEVLAYVKAMQDACGISRYAA